MQFDSKSGADAGRKGGGARWKGKDPETLRNKQIRACVTRGEHDMISGKAAALRVSRTELIVRSVRAYKERKKTGKTASQDKLYVRDVLNFLDASTEIMTVERDDKKPNGTGSIIYTGFLKNITTPGCEVLFDAISSMPVHKIFLKASRLIIVCDIEIP